MRMIIVDDDVQIREGMRDGVDWKAIGIDSVESFGNVQDALQDMQRYQTDIVITDIKMPEISGIEFLKRIRETDNYIKVILISGYADFEYAKEGIRYGARDYILKPIKVRDLIRVIQDTVQEIIKSRKSKEEQLKAEEVNKEKFIQDLLGGKLFDRNIILESINRYFELNLGNFILCVLVEKRSGLTSGYLEEVKRTSDEAVLSRQLDKEKAILICAASNSTIYNINLKYSLMNRLLDLKADFVGISEVHNVEEVGTAFKEAMKCLNLLFIKDEVRGYIYQQQDFEGKKKIKQEEIQLKLLGFWEKGEEYECYKWLDEFLAVTQREYITDKEELIKLICANLLYMKGHLASGQSISFEMSLEQVEGELEAATSLANLIKIWKNIYQKFFDFQKNVNDSEYPIDVQKALRFIYEHYRERISAKIIADYVGKSENYFRLYFKTITGISIKDFINNYRIEQAERLLKYSDIYVYEISEYIGFQDYTYFTKVFKKIKGYPPTSIRKNEE